MIPELEQIKNQIQTELKLKKESSKTFYLSILGGIAVLLLIGGFLYYGRYYLAAAITGLIITGIIQVLWLVYADNRAEESKLLINIMAAQSQKQLDFAYNRMNYLFDIALKVDPVTAHAINNIPVTPPPVEPEEYVIPELGTANDVMVRRVRE